MVFGKRKKPGLSVIAIFFNMRREAPRTLHSLSRGYQQLDASSRYEVLAIDNGSTTPLSAIAVRSFGPEFQYHYMDTDHPSPCATINQFIANAHFDNVMILIDGARILSPGIINLTYSALSAFPHPFIYTLGMHIGAKPQNYLVNEGYNQSMEDALFESIDWRSNGYSLFSISSVGLSSREGFFSRLTESNCFTLRKDDFVKAGLYQAQFQSPGGGLCNLEVFNRLNTLEWIQPVMLLGEATFHQFHGGVATNVPLDQHPWKAMEKEYARIVGENYRHKFRSPLYFGALHGECAKLYNAIDRDEPG
jgi:glycosyltransferase involved in cell wall biosynthesis